MPPVACLNAVPLPLSCALASSKSKLNASARVLAVLLAFPAALTPMLSH